MSNSLRLITYNIHRCIGGDRNRSPQRISAVIAAHQPDIVALQEVDCGQVRPALYDQAALIAEQLNFPEVWIERERCGNAVLSRYPMKRIKAGGLHRVCRWHTLARRGALWVEIAVFGTQIRTVPANKGSADEEISKTGSKGYHAFPLTHKEKRRSHHESSRLSRSSRSNCPKSPGCQD